MAAAKPATGVANPPNVVMVSMSQYNVPPKYTTPARNPRKKARRRDVACAAATVSGARAIQANAGCPNFGKLSARNTPVRSASAA